MAERLTMDLDDIQATLLRPRPKPYRGQYVLVKVGDAEQGREMIRRLLPYVAPCNDWWEPGPNGWLGIVFTFQGLLALGLPQESLDSFPEEFKQGMAARAPMLNDLGSNAPEHWEAPFGSPDVHVALALYAKDDECLARVIQHADEGQRDLDKITVLYRLRFRELPEGRNPFGFRDGLHNPAVEGSGDAEPAREPSVSGEAAPAFDERPVKAGEFVLGYPDEQGLIASKPVPEELRKNGTFVALRKFYTDVAAFRRYLHENSNSEEEQELLAAKMVGRWRSGAP
jgi:deferrochelatase/peroxidase EfeB